MKKWALLLLCLLCGVNAWCQKKDSTKSEPFFKNFQLRQSFQTADQQQSPAQLQFTLPGDGKNSWLVDAAVSLSVAPLSSGPFTSKIIAEYHRNTIVDAPVYNYQAGYSFNYLQRGTNNLRLLLTGNVKYINNLADTNRSFAITLNFAGYRNALHGLNWDHPFYLDNKKYTYQFSPYLEAQYQQLSANGAGKSGSIFRPVADLSGSFAINKQTVSTGDHKKVKLAAPSKLIELAVDYTNRYAVINSTGNGEGFTKLFKAGLNYYFISNSSSSVSMGASYNQGSDPLNGLKDQRFWQFSLQVQL